MGYTGSKLSFFLALTAFTIISSSQGFNFSKKYFGVGHSPYVKYYETMNGELNYPPWNLYTYEHIQAHMELLVKRVGFIVTFGMDIDENSPWINLEHPWGNESVNNPEIPKAAFVMRAAAEANRNNAASGSHLQVIQGVYQKDSKEAQDAEIKRAFEGAKEANSISANTVYGLSFYNLFNLDERAYSKLISAYENYRSEAKSLNITIGTRLHRCNNVLKNSSDDDKKHSDLIRRIAKVSDFVLCSIFPSEEDVHLGPSEAIERISSEFLKSRNVLLNENSKLRVFNGETAWPSNGPSYNKGDLSTNTMNNTYLFWTGMNEWAIEHKTEVVMFEAFDEPWKSNPRIKDKNNPGGFYGAEGHYGWWRLRNNNDPYSLYEKYLEAKEYQKLEVLEGVSESILESQKESLQGTPNKLLIVGIVALIILMILQFIVNFYKQFGNQKAKYSLLTEKEINDFLCGSIDTYVLDTEVEPEEALKLPYNREQFELEVSAFEIDEHTCLGSGNFGTVFRGVLSRNGKTYEAAFKTMKDPNNVSALKGLLSEIKIMGYVGKHSNIVRYFGSYTSQIREGIVYAVVELCPLGNLKDYILKHKGDFISNLFSDKQLSNAKTGENSEFNFGMLRKWSVGVAIGMEYLGTKNVIHGDLALRNILLSSDRTAKITDFGLSRRLYAYTEYVKTSQELLPWRWMAIESLRRMTFSLKSDVWAFGVTLWEIFALGDIPYPGLNWSITFLNQLEKGLRMSKPQYSTDVIFTSMRKCWESNPADRPSFQNLIDILEQSQD